MKSFWIWLMSPTGHESEVPSADSKRAQQPSTKELNAKFEAEHPEMHANLASKLANAKEHLLHHQDANEASKGGVV
jgi:hypothetical protein